MKKLHFNMLSDQCSVLFSLARISEFEGLIAAAESLLAFYAKKAKSRMKIIIIWLMSEDEVL